MPILDDIGKKISQTTQSALKNTKDAADISRINSLLAEEQKLIGSFYTQIGMKYCELYPETTDENFASLCYSVMETAARITALEHEIQDIRGIKRCPRCSAEIPATTPFCGACGYDTRNEPVLEAPKRLCPSCSSEIADSMAFCTACGLRI